MSAVILRGDARALPLPDASVDLICTSPPFFALRSYTDGGSAYDSQIGAEATPAEYLANLWEYTQEWKRVLKPDGSIFVNLGDKYSQYEGARKGHGRSIGRAGREARGEPLRMPVSAPDQWGIAAKSLMLLPERYRIGCVDQLGLLARAVVIWSKPNGLPESVTDRVRRAHEDWVHLTKQRRYFSAVDDIRERHTDRSPHAMSRRSRTDNRLTAANAGQTSAANPLGKLPGSVWEIATQPLTVPDHLGVDHYAAFPSALVRRIILGWSPSGICTVCGQARQTVTDTTRRVNGGLELPAADLRHGDARQRRRGATSSLGESPQGTITGYSCACPEPSASTRPATVVDPFGGTGTTALVADVHGRHGISIDRSADYCRLARWRTTDPGERARSLGVPKPTPVMAGQIDLFGEDVAS